MPIPASINDLSTTAGSNSPAGSESPSLIDDYLRTYASYIALLRDAAQNNSFNIATAGGSANAITATYSPAVTTLTDQMTLSFKASLANTAAATFSPNGLAAKPIVGVAHAALRGGEIIANGEVSLIYNSSVGGGSWVLVFSTGADPGRLQSQGLTAFTSAGTSPALTLTPAPALTGYAANQRFRVKFSAGSTGADTLNISGLGAKSLKQYGAAGAKIAAGFASGQLSDVEYDGTDMVVLDPLPTGSLITRISSATVQAVSGTTVTPQVFTPLSYSFTGDGGVYRIFVKINLEVETINAATGPSNAAVIKLLNGATPLDISATNISVPEVAGRSMVLAWSGTLSGSVVLTATFEKTWANGSITVNGDRDDNTSNISGQQSSIEVYRMGA